MTDDSTQHPRVAESVLRLHEEARAGMTEVEFEGGPTVLATTGQALLDIAEANGVPIESGCRMGMCGADPVRILAGEQNLSTMRSAERRTLERLGLTSGCRMACVARVQGSVRVSRSGMSDSAAVAPTSVSDSAEPVEAPAPPRPAAAHVARVVIVGTGVGGITAAEEVRRLHPDAEIAVLGAEPYDFYNRMAISKLLSESTAIDRLYLITRDWAESRGIRYLPGVAASYVDREKRQLITEEGECIPYDRLVLATGARAFVPPVDGFGMGGTFVLRTIDDAVSIQQHVRRRRARLAVVVGGGLLGLEAAANIAQIGVRVFVLDIGAWPLSRQLDERAGVILRQMMSDLGIEVLPETSALRILGGEWVDGVELTNGQHLRADLCLVATGIQPDIALAQSADLEVRRGVIVDDRMQTSDPDIYAVGDVVEHATRIYGLWPSSVDQARVAAANLLGGEARYRAVVPPARLKVPGIDLLSVGQIEALKEGERELRIEEGSGREYRKLVLAAGRLRGAIVLGYQELFDPVTEAVEAGLDVTQMLPELERGDWSGLAAGESVERTAWRNMHLDS